MSEQRSAEPEERGLRIGSFAGAPIIVDSTILLLAAYIVGTAVLNSGVAALPGALIFLGALLLAVLMHEFGHAGVAAALKLQSKRIVLTFLGGHVEFVNPPRVRWQDALVSFSGPAVNLLTWVFVTALMQPGGLASDPSPVTDFLTNLAYVSLILGVLNLLPGFPLDGGRILAALLGYVMHPERARLVAAWMGVVLAIGLIIFAAVNQLIWTILIAVFLALVAWSETRRAGQALAAATR